MCGTSVRQMSNSFFLSASDQVLIAAMLFVSDFLQQLVMMLIYSRSIRRDFQGFFSMMALIFDLLVLFLCVVLIATVISLKVMHVSHEAAGGEEEEELELYINEYGSFGPSFVTLWMGLFGEGYPENMIPQYMGNSLILFFFIPYMLIGKFILEPIPVALLEHSYKHSRSHNMVVDRLVEKEALFACFVCMHTHK